MAKKGSSKKNKKPEQILLEKEARKERKRAQALVRRIKKRGYSVPDNIVPNLPKNITEGTLRRFKKINADYVYNKAVYVQSDNSTISGTKRRTQERYESAKKGAEKRKKYYSDRNKELSQAGKPNYNYSDYGDYNDEAIPDYDANKPPSDTKIVLETIRGMIDTWEPDPRWSAELAKLKARDKNALENLLNDVINSDGEEIVARRLENDANEAIRITESILYDSGNSYKVRGIDGVQKNLAAFAAIIKGSPLTIEESARYTDFGEKYGSVGY